MKVKLFFALMGTLGISSLAHAQTTVKGKVVDSKGQSISDISVSVGSKSTKTDSNGQFQLYVDQKGAFELLLGGVGFQRNRIKVAPKGDQTLLEEITLQKADHAIDQVDITGYNSVNTKTVGVAKSGILDRDLPQSVQIINSQVIKDQQINTLADALKNANGIALGANRGGVGENFYARGYSMGSNNIFKNGARTNNGGQIEASTLESVEILKGSAALLYGGVTGGAVVNMTTKKPKFELGGEVSMRYGSWDAYKPTLDVYGPLSNKVAFRFIGTGSSANSYRDVVKSNRVYVNPSVLYKISDRTELNVNFDYLKSNFTPDFGIGSVEGKLNDAVGRGTFLNVNGAFNNTNSTNGQAALDHNFNDNWKISAIASMQNYNRNYYGSERLQANAQGLAPRSLSRSQTEEFTMNQQLNLTGKFNTGGIKHQLLFGADADQSSTKAYAYDIYADLKNPSKVTTFYDSINVFDPYAAGMRMDIPNTAKNAWTKTDVYRYGTFIQDLISVTDKFKVLAGIRYTYQRTPYADKYNYKTGITEEIKNLDINKKELGAKEDKAWSPKFALIYQPIKSTSMYVSYSNNFISNTGYDINYQPLSPSIVDHYEAGVKNDFFRGHFSTNLTVYRINNSKFTQMAFLDANGSANGDPNMKEFSGKTSSDGVELDITGRLLPGLDMMAGYAYNFMRYTETMDIYKYKTAEGKDAETSGSEEGVRLVGTTAHTGNATVFYTVQNGSIKGLKVGFSAFYTGKRNAGWNNSKINVRDGMNRLVPVDPFTTLDLSLGYSIGRLSLLAKVANVTNELSYFIHENYSVNPIPPRNFMTTLSYKF
ncbi:iron complex outermembrane recepter protein [Sphingobacterium nematocida]|uniref:Iron complex outermembrane recepter protein n=1 Tax=Sphingobacterium nematocida TaxID=1513896 RepID=A0A1T5G862_9SPHI|nr:TonB-dependent siderophore receptor [Sphingobacterium nematocida]SKC04670.1 iron complex outermembrane recepter protein [Sphingobacterium nematocida]